MWRNEYTLFQYFFLSFEGKNRQANISWIVLHKFVKLNYVELKIILLMFLHSVQAE